METLAHLINQVGCEAMPNRHISINLIPPIVMKAVSIVQEQLSLNPAMEWMGYIKDNKPSVLRFNFLNRHILKDNFRE